jgi:proteasome activator subunit 4
MSRVATMVCKWMYSTLLDLNAAMVFDLVLPLMPELFRFSECSSSFGIAILTAR